MEKLLLGLDYFDEILYDSFVIKIYIGEAKFLEVSSIISKARGDRADHTLIHGGLDIVELKLFEVGQYLFDEWQALATEGAVWVA